MGSLFGVDGCDPSLSSVDRSLESSEVLYRERVDRHMQIKILHIIASADPASGGPIEGILRQEAVTGGQSKRAVREIVTLDQPGSAWAEGFPVRLHCLGEPQTGVLKHTPVGRFLKHYGYMRRYIPWIRANMHRFDVAIVHGLWNYSAFAASRVLPGNSLPYVVFTHGMMDPWFRNRYPMKHIAKQISWSLYEGRLLAGARSVLFTTEEERVLARTSFRGHSYRETVVGYGTSAPPETTRNDRETLYNEFPEIAGKRFLLFMSRIHEKKGLDELIKAFAEVAEIQPDLHLVIAGPDQQGRQASLQELARALLIEDRIIWPGPIYGKLKWAIYRESEAFVLPSHQENFGIVVAEALACSVPVLITNKVNIWREVAEAGAGLVCDDNQSSIKAQLTTWNSLSPRERSTMGTAAHNLFQHKFSMEKIAPRIIDTLSELVTLK